MGPSSRTGFYDSLIATRNIDRLINSSQYGLRADNDEHVQLAASACAAIGQDAIPNLIEALDEFALMARMAVAEQLWVDCGINYFEMSRTPVGAYEVDREIQRRLDQRDPHPCHPPALALLSIGEASVLPLVDYLALDKDWLAREAAVWALGALRDPRAIPHLRRIPKFMSFDRLSKAARAAIRRINA